MSIDQTIDKIFEPIAKTASDIVFYDVMIMGYDIKLILIWLLGAALFFTFYLGFINIRFFKHSIDIVRGKYDDPKDAQSGQISRFQALATSLSGTVGLGNIAGVAVAISIGGPGAVFWMLLMGIFSMSTKFAEVAMGVKYRHRNKAGHPENISGGPMYYLRDAFANRDIPYLGPIVAGAFAVACVAGSIGAGNMFQSNQAYQMVVNVTGGAEGFFGDKGWLFGLGLAVMVGLVIIGGIKSIGAVAGRLVPAMAGIYMVAALVVIVVNIHNVPDALASIFVQAFEPAAGIGGLMGALLVGVQRAAFSNEAGLGSAAIVHATAQTDDHVSQGMVAMIGPFIDTVVICLVTALVIVISGAHLDADGVEGIHLTSKAMETGASWFPYVLALTVFLFAYSTLITWFYYGVKGLTFLFGSKGSVENIYKLIFLACIVIGASSEVKSIIIFADAMILSMAIPNLIGLYLLAPEIKRDLKEYIKKIKAKSVA